jgi:hypothetical protein
VRRRLRWVGGGRRRACCELRIPMPVRVCVCICVCGFVSMYLRICILGEATAPMGGGRTPLSMLQTSHSSACVCAYVCVVVYVHRCVEHVANLAFQRLCVCMYLCVCVYVYEFCVRQRFSSTGTYVYIYIYIYIYTHTHTCTYLHGFAHVFAQNLPTCVPTVVRRPHLNRSMQHSHALH